MRHGHLLPPVGMHDFDPTHPTHVSISHSRVNSHQRMHVTIQGEPSQMDDNNDDNDEEEDEDEMLPLIATNGEAQDTIEVSDLCKKSCANHHRIKNNTLIFA